jgi:arylformamidase
MRYIDISQVIEHGMKKYPSDPGVEVRAFKSLKKGNTCNLFKLVLGSHTGTHIDAPRHVYKKGRGVDKIKLENLICKVTVTDTGNIFKKGSMRKIKHKKIEGVLLKGTGARSGLTVEQAGLLLENNIKLVGTELMSIEEGTDRSHPVHRLLLGKGAVIVENLNLRKVKAGYYTLICLPLKIREGDGSPVRAVLAYD